MEKPKIKTKTKKKTIKKLIFISIILILALGLFMGQNYYKDALGPMSKGNPENIHLEIPPGSSTKHIGNLLKDKGLIKDINVFKYKVKSMDLDGGLKAGDYSIDTGMDLEDIIVRVSQGGKSKNTVRFTIPEGYELRQIGEKLFNENLIQLDEFMDLVEKKENFEDDFQFLKDLEENQSLEGFLFPSTYEIYINSSEKDIIGKMLEQFEKIYFDEISPKLDEFNFTLNQAITLASIVEREGKLDSERPVMSAVFHNRLGQNMNLQSCATVQYILGERKENLSTADTRISSPFNTYINSGLPPKPIASPGKVSIIAALNPDDVDYLFFVKTGDDGSHTFTKTYGEHLEAKEKYGK